METEVYHEFPKIKDKLSNVFATKKNTREIGRKKSNNKTKVVTKHIPNNKC